MFLAHAQIRLDIIFNLVAQDLSTWTQQNRMVSLLVTNTLKTKTMLIHSPQQLKNTSDRSLSVILNGNMLAQVKQAKVLGLTLDEFLIWTKHIDNLCSTINSRLALLRRIKPFLTKDCALRFYNSNMALWRSAVKFRAHLIIRILSWRMSI